MKKKVPWYVRWMEVAGVIVTAITVVFAGYIMIHKMGLVKGLNFGAGSYFYADIPQFQKYVNGNHFTSSVSMGTLIVLFLLWGALMYKAWVWLERKM